MKSIGELLGSEGINAATVLALSGTLIALVARGGGPLSLKRVVAQTLSNPVPAVAVGTRSQVSVTPSPQRVAA